MAEHPLPSVGSPLHASKYGGLLLGNVLQPLLEIITVEPEDTIPNARKETPSLLRDDRGILLCRLAFSSSAVRRHQARSHTKAAEITEPLIKAPSGQESPDPIK